MSQRRTKTIHTIARGHVQTTAGEFMGGDLAAARENWGFRRDFAQP
jgi:hypothetical protein